MRNKTYLGSSFIVYFVVDDIVLISKTSDGVNVELEMCRETLESSGFKLRGRMIKYIDSLWYEHNKVVVKLGMKSSF